MIAKVFRFVRRNFIFQKVGNLSVGREVDFDNQGEIKSGLSYLGGINNLTVKLLNSRYSKSFVLNQGKIVVGNNVRIHKGFGIHVGKGAVLTIGNNSYINPHSVIVCHSEISIGADCAISWNVELLDDDLHTIHDQHNKQLNESLPIRIGDRVWIGAGSKILKGAQIGNGAVIAAGSVVTGIILSNSLYGGIPAKKIKEDVKWK